MHEICLTLISLRDDVIEEADDNGAEIVELVTDVIEGLLETKKKLPELGADPKYTWWVPTFTTLETNMVELRADAKELRLVVNEASDAVKRHEYVRLKRILEGVKERVHGSEEA